MSAYRGRPGGTLTLLIRALPSAHYEPLRHPKAPSLSLAGFRLVIADHALGHPVLRTLSLCTCCRHYPRAAAGRTLRSTSPSRISLPRKGCRVGLRIVLFEDCSAFTRVTACTLALSPIRDTLIGGFSHFVTSMTASPIASGWSGCRVRLREIVGGAIMQHTSAKRIKANEKAEELIRVRLSMIADDIEGNFALCRHTRQLQSEPMFLHR